MIVRCIGPAGRPRRYHEVTLELRCIYCGLQLVATNAEPVQKRATEFDLISFLRPPRPQSIPPSTRRP